MTIKNIAETAYLLSDWWDTTLTIEGWFDQEYGPAAAGGANTLTVSPGTVAIVGQSVNLRVARVLTASPGTVAIVGQSVTLRAARQLTVSPATVPITGQSVTLRAARQLTVSPGTVAINGQSVDLRVARQLSVSPGIVAINGQSVDLIFTPATTGNTLDVLPAIVAVTGQTVTLTATQAQAGDGRIDTGGDWDIYYAGRRKKKKHPLPQLELFTVPEVIAAKAPFDPDPLIGVPRFLPEPVKTPFDPFAETIDAANALAPKTAAIKAANKRQLKAAKAAEQARLVMLRRHNNTALAALMMGLSQ